MQRRLGGYAVAATLVLIATVPPAMEAQSLYWLGTLGGTRSDAYAVSADGRVVGGSARDSQERTRAFRWTRSEGLQPLEDFPSLTAGEARGVSANGAVIVGWINTGQGERAFRWTEAAGMELLTSVSSRALGVSADGNVVVGWAQQQAFRWTPQTGLQAIGGNSTQAWGVSADGRTVVGRMLTGSAYEAFRWTETHGMQGLGVPANGLQSYAYAVSADGKVVVGAWSTRGSTRVRAFRWSEEHGMHTITPDDEWLSDARGVSADGSLVVGIAAYYAHGRAFRWSPETGAENLNELFAFLIPDGSHLSNAFALSPDGRYIVGVGHNWQTMRYEAFLLDTWREGDTNGDYRIDDADLLAVLFAFGSAGTGDTRHEDVNHDGTVNDADLLTVLLRYDGDS
ncbi:MAG: hypothetical protein N2651_07815 [Fimbriimonadales bacterium]|nr:hypothetical protein [Fimbriimonadales bacterium]